MINSTPPSDFRLSINELVTLKIENEKDDRNIKTAVPESREISKFLSLKVSSDPPSRTGLKVFDLC